jgi:hypothetical protein
MIDKTAYWEFVESANGRYLFSRCELPHGWLIRMLPADGGHITFIPKADVDGW